MIGFMDHFYFTKKIAQILMSLFTYFGQNSIVKTILSMLWLVNSYIYIIIYIYIYIYIYNLHKLQFTPQLGESFTLNSQLNIPTSHTYIAVNLFTFSIFHVCETQGYLLLNFVEIRHIET